MGSSEIEVPLEKLSNCLFVHIAPPTRCMISLVLKEIRVLIACFAPIKISSSTTTPNIQPQLLKPHLPISSNICPCGSNCILSESNKCRQKSRSRWNLYPERMKGESQPPGSMCKSTSPTAGSSQIHHQVEKDVM
jgi:hypothetical protein